MRRAIIAAMFAGFSRVVGALLLLACLSAPAHAQQGDTGAPFVDHFGVIDSGRWRVSDGWSNGDWTANDWRASQVVPGPQRASLLLAPARGAKRFSSGELQTHALYPHGYFEARMQAPRGSGLVTGFFTFTRDGDASTWDEIDVEILGRDTRSAQFTYYSRGAKRFIIVPLGFDAADGAHTYAFDWSADHIRWYVDGVLRHEETGDGLRLPTRPQRLFVNLWNSATLTDWVGPINAPGPWALRLSCVAEAAQAPPHPLCG